MIIKPKPYTPNIGGLKYLQEKLNGWRVILKNGRAYSRTQDITHLWPKELPYPLLYSKKYWLDGELHCPLEPSSSVIHLLKNKSHMLTFSPFAVPQHPTLKFEQVMHELEVAGLTVPYWRPITKTINPQELLEEAQSRSIEGWVLKRAHYEGWYKLKPERTVDCIVIGVNPGKGKYSGMIGSLEVAIIKDKRLVPIADVSGLQDAQRQLHPNEFLHRVIEVAYQEVGSKGRLLHPRFKRFRPDKPHQECTWS